MLKGVKTSPYTEKYQDHIPCSFANKGVCIDNVVKKLCFIGKQMQFIHSLKQFLESMIIVKNNKLTF